MEIKIKPADLIKRFIWDKYEYFCLEEKTSSEISEIIEKNEEFVISEYDAFVINLINVIYTPEVIYKFKQFILEILSNKSFEFEDETDGRKKLYINQQILIYSVTTFKNKIPKNWQSDDFEFNTQLNQLVDKFVNFIESVENLDTTQIQEYPCVKCAQVKKIVNKI